MYKIVTVAFVFCLAGCGASEIDSAKIEAEVRDALVGYADAINAGDAAAAGAFYDDGGEFYWVERGRIQYDNVDAARKSLQNLADSNYTIAIKMQEVKVSALSPTSAFASGLFETIFTPPEGESFGLGGWMSVGMVKRKDGWYMAGGHTETVAVQEGQVTE